MKQRADASTVTGELGGKTCPAGDEAAERSAIA
jgi:hypothetical protein